MSKMKCQMSIRLNFCRSVPPEFLRSFFFILHLPLRMVTNIDSPKHMSLCKMATIQSYANVVRMIANFANLLSQTHEAYKRCGKTQQQQETVSINFLFKAGEFDLIEIPAMTKPQPFRANPCKKTTTKNSTQNKVLI